MNHLLTIRIKKAELVWRDILITFVGFAFHYVFFDAFLEIPLHYVLIVLPMFIYVFYPIAKRFRGEAIKVLTDPFEDDTVYKYWGIALLYFLVQLGICLVFFKSFTEYTFIGVPFCYVLFSFTSGCITWLYTKNLLDS